MAIFTIIIFVHELGHFVAAKLLGFKVQSIEMYVYGGCTKLDMDINSPLLKELIILLMGPIFQVLFVCIIGNFIDFNNYMIFKNYSLAILVFNLLPIYPLDGGKLLLIIFSYFTSFYKSLKLTLYFSYFLFMILALGMAITYNDFIIYLVLFFLLLNIFKEIKKAPYIYKKFLLERYLKNYDFKKLKNIKEHLAMKKDYYHFINLEEEKSYLKKLFNSYYRT